MRCWLSIRLTPRVTGCAAIYLRLFALFLPCCVETYPVATSYLYTIDPLLYLLYTQYTRGYLDDHAVGAVNINSHSRRTQVLGGSSALPSSSRFLRKLRLDPWRPVSNYSTPDLQWRK